jgi:hypothetical protein
MKIRSFLILHEPDPEPKGGGKAADPPPAEPPADINKRIEGLWKAHGDANGAVRALLAERDQAHAQLAEARARLPKEGHRVIDPEAGKALDEYQALGLKPADVKAALAERDDLKARTAKRDREDHLGRVAAVSGFTAPVLTTLAERDGLDIVIVEDKDPKAPGKTIQVAKVKGKDEKGVETLTPLPEHAETHWGDFLSSLRGGPGPAPAPPRGTPPPSSGPPRPPVKPAEGARPRSNPLS